MCIFLLKILVVNCSYMASARLAIFLVMTKSWLLIRFLHPATCRHLSISLVSFISGCVWRYTPRLRKWICFQFYWLKTQASINRFQIHMGICSFMICVSSFLYCFRVQWIWVQLHFFSDTIRVFGCVSFQLVESQVLVSFLYLV